MWPSSFQNIALVHIVACQNGPSYDGFQLWLIILKYQILTFPISFYVIDAIYSPASKAQMAFSISFPFILMSIARLLFIRNFPSFFEMVCYFHHTQNMQHSITHWLNDSEWSLFIFCMVTYFFQTATWNVPIILVKAFTALPFAIIVSVYIYFSTFSLHFKTFLFLGFSSFELDSHLTFSAWDMLQLWLVKFVHAVLVVVITHWAFT